MSALDVLRAYVAAWNDHRVDVIVGLYDAGARRVSPLGALEGRDAIRSFVQGFFAMSPDTVIELGRTAENQTDVLFEFIDRGTHQGGVFPLFWTPDLGCQLTELPIS